MHRAPVPAFPTDRAERHSSRPDQVGETQHCAQPVIQISPLMMGRIEHGYGSGAILPFHTADLSADNVECLVPPDRLVSADAAVLRIPCAMRIEVHTFQWCQDALVGVDKRLERQRMRAWYRLAPGRERPAAGVDGPTSRIRTVQIDRRGTEDLASSDVNEDRAAVCQ